MWSSRGPMVLDSIAPALENKLQITQMYFDVALIHLKTLRKPCES